MRDFRLFLGLYCIYLTPIIYSLWTYVPSPLDQALPFEAPTCEIVVVYFGLCTFYYFANNWLLYATGGTVRVLAAAQRKEDLLRMYTLALPMLSFARIENRLRETPLEFVVIFLFFGFFYTLLYESGKRFDIVFTPKSLARNVYALTIVALTTVVVVWCLKHHIELFWRLAHHWSRQTGLLVLLLIGIHVALHWLPASVFVPEHVYDEENKGTQTFLHLHHWWWAYPCAAYCVASTLPSFVGCAMFTTCHLHGLATFGCSPVFNEFERPVLLPKKKQIAPTKALAAVAEKVTASVSPVISRSNSRHRGRSR
jgi:hypothetical protein